MTNSSPPTLSAVVPVYNSAETLPLLLERLTAVLSVVAAEYEIILVNDGSRDESWPTIVELAAAYPHLRGINLMRNYGQHNALLAGIRAARYEVIITLDDDLQNPPEEIPKLLAKLAEGYDVVYGAPERQQHGLWRDLASEITKLALQSVMGAETARYVSAFRAFRAPLREAFAAHQASFVSIDVLLTWGAAAFGVVWVRHEPRESGVSNYSFTKLVTHALNMITGFSVWPLQLASILGFGLTLFGGLILAYVLGRYTLDGGSVPGFPFLASIIAIFSGAQLFTLGIIGEYLARMYFRLMNKPIYVIRTETHSEPEG
jgi:undecaprenyl-phosphate 4-deoxy-4-formamido-L-arabinose transferase